MIEENESINELEEIDVNSNLPNDGAYPNIKSTCILFVSLVLNGIIVLIISLILVDRTYLHSPVVKLVQYVVPILITIMNAVKRAEKRQAGPLKIKFNKTEIYLIPLLILGALALMVPLEGLSSLMPMPAAVRAVFEKVFTKDIFSIITVVLLAPVLEEILCRGIVLNGLLKNYSPPKAILVSAIFFAVVHLNPWQAVPAFFIGLFLGWVYYKTQSVIPGMIVHATVNATSTVLLFLPTHKDSLLSIMGAVFYLIAVIMSIGIFAGICLVINRKTSVIQPSIL